MLGDRQLEDVSGWLGAKMVFEHGVGVDRV
jgi:uncharacterized membrane protein